MTDFTMTTDADGVAVITWDVPNKSMNVLSLEGLAHLSDLIDQAHADEAVKGIVITSGKDTFAGGMDLNVIAKMKESAGDDPAKGLFEGTMQMHAILRKIELAGMDPKTQKGGKPTAAALPGTLLASVSNCHCPPTAFSRQITQKPKSACPKSSSVFSRALAAPHVCRASLARWPHRPCCLRAN